jgi:hypothetical protein
MDPQLVRWRASYMRHAMSPGAALTQWQFEWETDVRAILPTIHVPTLILHRAEDEPEANRYIADHIPGARYVALPGDEHIPYLADQGSVLDAIERFVLGVRDEEIELSSVLATVLFTDIVGSTKRAAELGIEAGETSWSVTTLRFAQCSHATGVPRSIRQVTASSRPSTDRHARSSARRPQSRRFDRSGSRSASACTPARSRRSMGRSVA